MAALMTKLPFPLDSCPIQGLPWSLFKFAIHVSPCTEWVQTERLKRDWSAVSFAGLCKLTPENCMNSSLQLSWHLLPRVKTGWRSPGFICKTGLEFIVSQFLGWCFNCYTILDLSISPRTLEVGVCSPGHMNRSPARCHSGALWDGFPTVFIPSAPSATWCSWLVWAHQALVTPCLMQCHLHKQSPWCCSWTSIKPMEGEGRREEGWHWGQSGNQDRNTPHPPSIYIYVSNRKVLWGECFW